MAEQFAHAQSTLDRLDVLQSARRPKLMTADPAAMLEAATQAARAAGGELMQRLAGTLDIRWKTYQGETTVVTDADMAADRAIREVLLARFPDHVILSEEVPHDDFFGPDVWVIDPLDGTDNYSRGQPQFCVSVAHATHGRIDVGVIFDPVRDELFTATSDGPAECNGATVRVTDRDDPAISAVAWAQAGASPEDSKRLREALPAAAAVFHRVRLTGSAALEMVWVAAGRFDGALLGNVKWWDQAAATLIVERAGGRATDVYGRPMGPDSRRCVLSNGRIHQAMLDLAHAHDLHLAFPLPAD